MKQYLRSNKWSIGLAVGLFIAAAAAHAGMLPDALMHGLSVDHGAMLVGLGTVARSATVAPFPTDPSQTGIAIAYKNERLIAADVMPIVEIGTKEYRYDKFDLRESFTLPDTHVGRRSKTNSVEFASSEVAGMVEDHGLQTPIPLDDIEAAAKMGRNKVNEDTEMLTELVMLGREKRCADKVFGAGNYKASNKTTLTSTARWSQSASTPIADIEAAKDVMVMRPNIGVFGRKTWRFMSQHAAIVSAIQKNEGTKGIVTRRAVAELFELEDIYVGEGWLNVAKPGQDANMVRVWGEHCALLYRNRLAKLKGLPTFGFMARYNGWFAANFFDRDQGLRGSQVVRVGESTEHVVTADDLGFLFVNAGNDA